MLLLCHSESVGSFSMVHAVERGHAEWGPVALQSRELCVLAWCWQQEEHKRDKASTERCVHMVLRSAERRDRQGEMHLFRGETRNSKCL